MYAKYKRECTPRAFSMLGRKTITKVIEDCGKLWTSTIYRAGDEVVQDPFSLLGSRTIRASISFHFVSIGAQAYNL